MDRPNVVLVSCIVGPPLSGAQHGLGVAPNKALARLGPASDGYPPQQRSAAQFRQLRNCPDQGAAANLGTPRSS